MPPSTVDSAPASAGHGTSSVRVRMFRQGLGDCFLLTFTGADGGSSNVLIDCGVLKGTRDAASTMQRLAGVIGEATSGRLDVLVATHEHWDHVSGFLQAQTAFEQIEVGETWLAWTEDPGDPLAAELRHQRRNAAAAVAAATRPLAAAGGRSARLGGEIRAILEFAAGEDSTAGAMRWVAERARGRPNYLRPGTSLALPGAGAAGVRVYVLGPPHDRAQIKRSDPSKRHPEVYGLTGNLEATRGFHAAAAAHASGEPVADRPFDDWFTIRLDEAEEVELFERSYTPPGEAWRSIEHDWLGVAGSLALQLDADTNNTSLVLAFELPDGRVLLFPGDAQVGNWLSWDELAFQVPSNGGSRAISAADLLSRTVLYKVGHHGSHNATLRERGLELMTSPDLVAMIPVGRAMARKHRWSMPFPPLRDRLLERTRGRVVEAETPFAPHDVQLAPWAATAEWQSWRAGVPVEKDWIDYTLSW